MCVCRSQKLSQINSCVYVRGAISCVCIKGLKIDHRSKVVCVYLGGGQSCVCTKYLKIDCRSTVVCVRGRGETNFMCASKVSKLIINNCVVGEGTWKGKDSLNLISGECT